MNVHKGLRSAHEEMTNMSGRGETFARSREVCKFLISTDAQRFIWDAVDEAGQGEVPNGIGDAIESAISTFYSNILLQLNFIKCRTPLQMSDFLKFS